MIKCIVDSITNKKATYSLARTGSNERLFNQIYKFSNIAKRLQYYYIPQPKRCIRFGGLRMFTHSLSPNLFVLSVLSKRVMLSIMLLIKMSKCPLFNYIKKRELFN